ncbi:uncharacterized protein LOC135488567 [Lineus longissimus]|uniref:uncharacterized protein LOC135488567 n=1 Tax=Lineus longissimus TaxID=88925 RepID=UPI00315C95A7
MGDLEAMFHQVKVTEHHRDYLRFLWYPEGDLDRPPEIYRMTSHPFGAVSSPACAASALRQCALDGKDQASEAVVDSLIKSFYVDDFLKSLGSDDQAIDMRESATAVCSKGGWRLHKWNSNSEVVNEAIPPSERSKTLQLAIESEQPQQSERALGIVWDTETDTFTFKIRIKEKSVTRRGILSVVSSIFYPLGLAGPFVLPARILLQRLCRERIGWDDEIGDKEVRQWEQWLVDILQLENVSVPRSVKPLEFTSIVSTQLHAFADASDSGYGIAVYTRLEDDEGRIQCTLLFGKARVAPIKKVTTPRMELTAASVAVKFVAMITAAMELKFDKTFYWTDSMSVLRYIANTTIRFHTFVANRVTTIQEGSTLDQWRYVPTQTNPADAASRGIQLGNQQATEQWLSGPKFLWEPESEWPKSNFSKELLAEDPNVKKVHATIAAENPEPNGENQTKTCTVTVDELFARYSNWDPLKTTVAWLLRAQKGFKQCRSTGKTLRDTTRDELTPLSFTELKAAELDIVRYLQKKHLPDNGKHLGSVQKLDPFLDDAGLLRVGGRLRHARIPLEVKHPVLLPKDSPVTRLIVRDAHQRVGHLGSNSSLNLLRQRYWIPRASLLIRSIISKCTICRKYRARLLVQKMADLPLQRLEMDQPAFAQSGVDYFGPFIIKKGRNTTLKRYGVIFTCLSTRAVHLEVAQGLTTDSCINAIRRFAARRAVQKLRSDNGTNLVGACKEMKEELRKWNQSQIGSALRRKGIEWDFNCPTASHHGGAWERLIRSVRRILYGVAKEQVIHLDDEGLQTLFCEVEFILNNRPITRVSNDTLDAPALTPNHLLRLHQDQAPPPGIFVKEDNYVKRKWRQIQHIANVFWCRWSKEYLVGLQERQKWRQEQRSLKKGDIVLVADNHMQRNQWLLGYVNDVNEDDKGLVRVVSVQTGTTVLKRPITKLCLILEAD